MLHCVQFTISRLLKEIEAPPPKKKTFLNLNIFFIIYAVLYHKNFDMFVMCHNSENIEILQFCVYRKEKGLYKVTKFKATALKITKNKTKKFAK